MTTHETSIEVTYDKCGRMQYHPDLHRNHGKPWTVQDEKYLIDNYELLGPEECSFSLERTIHTIMNRVYELRNKGEMPKATRRRNHRRMKRNS